MRLGFAVTRGVEGLDDTPLRELRQLGFGSIYVGCYEDEMRWHVERVAAFARTARAHALAVYVVPWGYGRVLDPDPAITSLYVHVHPHTLQIDNRGRRCRKACPNDPRFLEWFASSMRTLAWLIDCKGFLWDEPSLHYSRGDWACRCQYCQRLFRAAYSKELPTKFTDEVAQFRQNTIAMFLLAAAAAIQSVDQSLRSLVMPTPAGAYRQLHTGADNWNLIAGSSGVDALSALVPWQNTDTAMEIAVTEACEDALAACSPHGKDVILWLTAAPRDGYQVIETLRCAAQAGAGEVVIADYDLVLQKVADSNLIPQFRRLVKRLAE